MERVGLRITDAFVICGREGSGWEGQAGGDGNRTVHVTNTTHFSKKIEQKVIVK